MGRLSDKILSPLVSVLKVKLDEKQDKLTGTNGITVMGNTVSADLPMMVLSQEEYDALTEEEKQADVVYAVPDGESTGGGTGVTMEQVNAAIQAAILDSWEGSY